MKNVGKIGLAAGLAAAIYVLLRKRKDGTRLLDDVTHQIGKWANQLMELKEDYTSATPSTSGNGAVPRTTPKATTAGSVGRQQGDIQE
jgi:hypothetical protein